MRGKWITLALVAAFVIGLVLIVYPTFSNYWNLHTQTRAISNYTNSVKQLETAKIDQLLHSAQAYNQGLLSKPYQWAFPDAERSEYEAQLKVFGQGVIGHLNIPKIEVSLPLYLGTGEAVLQVGVGHFEGSSLPIGGLNTHSVLTGHRGLPSAKLLTSLDLLHAGDSFQITVLRETLTYEVDQVLVVAKDDAIALSRALEIVEDEDYCTLVTCTPYGINTERLLVRGHRVATIIDDVEIEIIPDVDVAQMRDPRLLVPLIAIPSVLLVLVILLIRRYRK